ncbi:unnamed protein product [Penicillium salamii]|nr:unnamed protein product [Penicillium salamii]
MARPSDAVSPEAPVASKRRASARLSAAEPEVKRIKSNTDLSLRQARSTTSKSKYFEAEDSDPDSEPDSESGESGGESAESVYEEAKDESSSADEAEPEELSESEEDTKKPTRGKKPATGNTNALKKKELWREGVKVDLEPGQEVVIAKPKARDAGDTPYEDETLHPNTRLFLIDLAANNDRQWLKGASYHAVGEWLADDLQRMIRITARQRRILRRTSMPSHPRSRGSTLLSLNFRSRIWCFASTGMSASAKTRSRTRSRTGKKGPYAAYYVHFQPGSCFVGCGLWNPEAEPLALLREEIDENSSALKEVLRAPEMRREFLKGASDDDDAVVDAFTHHNRESALKTKPKGYEADNTNIKLLRLRSFTIGRPITDEDLNNEAQEKIISLIEIMEPFVSIARFSPLS